MAAWLDLRKDILVEFYEQALLGRREDRAAESLIMAKAPCPQCGERVDNARASFCSRTCRSRFEREKARQRVTPETRAARKAAQYAKQSASLRAKWAERRPTDAKPGEKT